jgi:hypothetical protein
MNGLIGQPWLAGKSNQPLGSVPSTTRTSMRFATFVKVVIQSNGLLGQPRLTCKSNQHLGMSFHHLHPDAPSLRAVLCQPLTSIAACLSDPPLASFRAHY